MLKEENIDVSRIVAMVYDTTSVNTGVIKGIVTQLEGALGRSPLQLPCRHHIFELVCGAAAATVYGSTNGPKEEAFKTLVECWGRIDTSKYSAFKVLTVGNGITVSKVTN